MTVLEFHFDYLSPFAYLAWRRLPALADRHGATLVLRPVLFAGLLNHWGQKGPAEIPPKRAHTVRQVMREAARLGLPLVYPRTHPFPPLAALRASLPGVAREAQRAVVEALFQSVWERGEDVGSTAGVHAALARAGVDADAILARAGGAEAKAELRAAVAEAVGRGVFGVPTMILSSGELFWGNDQLDTIDAVLSGREGLDEARVAAILASGASAIRPAGAPALTPAVTRPSPAERPPSADRIAALFQRAPFARDTLGLRLGSYGDGWCEASLAIGEQHLQQDGYVHAGVQAAVADHTAGAAAATLMGEDQMLLSIEFKINMLRPAIGEVLRCRATALRAGRTISVVEAEVFAARGSDEKLVAKATVTLALVPLRA